MTRNNERRRTPACLLVDIGTGRQQALQDSRVTVGCSNHQWRLQVFSGQ